MSAVGQPVSLAAATAATVDAGTDAEAETGCGGRVGARDAAWMVLSRPWQMTSMESSVTKVLVATKQLIEALTAWGRQQASETDVSDVYVRLVNEFNLLRTAFGRSGIDMSDLVPIPDQLRTTLEAALANEASPDFLDEYLPQIREIIVSLLQGLKRKQARHRIKVSGEAIQTRQLRSQIGVPRFGTPRSMPSGPRQRTVSELVRSASSSLDPAQLSAVVPDSGPYAAQNPDGFKPGDAVKHPLDRVILNPGPPCVEPQTPPPIGSADKVLNKLQKSHTLHRRASKRYSDFNFAKLGHNTADLSSASFPATSSLAYQALHHDSVDLSESPSRSPANDTTPCNNAEHQVNGNGDSFYGKQVAATGITLFLKMNDAIRKVHFEGEVTLPALQLLFVEKFQYQPAENGFSAIYIQDPVNHVDYELEDLSDVRDRSILLLQSPQQPDSKAEVAQPVAPIAETGSKHIYQYIEQMQTAFSEQQGALKALINEAKSLVGTNTGSVANGEGAKTIESPFTLTSDGKCGKIKPTIQADAIRQDVAILQDIFADFTVSLNSKISLLVPSLVDEKTMRSRHDLEEAQNEMEQRSQSLMTRLDELSDIVDQLRTDITHRRMRPSNRQLIKVRQDAEVARNDLEFLRAQVTEVTPYWKAIWEKELQEIIDEQTFLGHTEKIVLDMQRDLDELLRLFADVQQCADILEKSPDVRRTVSGQSGRRSNSYPPTERLQSHNALLSEVRNLTPDHEVRVKAIAKVESKREEHKRKLEEEEKARERVVGNQAGNGQTFADKTTEELPVGQPEVKTVGLGEPILLVQQTSL